MQQLAVLEPVPPARKGEGKDGAELSRLSRRSGAEAPCAESSAVGLGAGCIRTKYQGTGDGTSEIPGTAAQESMTAPRARQFAAGLVLPSSKSAERSGDAVSLEAKMGIVVRLNESHPTRGHWL